MSGRRTYWHLEALRHKPTEYEIATSELLYYRSRGFEVNTPIAHWYERYQAGSALGCSDWERFHDPRETTYASYTALQHHNETFIEGLSRAIEETDHDARLTHEWLQILDAVLPTLRYPVHGLQMVAAYVGHMAPSGRIVAACAFQTGDELRRVHRLAFRMRQLQELNPAFGRACRARWEREPAWQPLRELIERLLVCYDWGESLVALNLVVKPAFDQVFMVWLARLAEAHGDGMLGKLLYSLDRDCRWHRDWTAELLRLCIEDKPDNRATVTKWIDRWTSRTTAAVRALAPLVAPSGEAEHAELMRAVARSSRDLVAGAGIERRVD